MGWGALDRCGGTPAIHYCGFTCPGGVNGACHRAATLRHCLMLSRALPSACCLPAACLLPGVLVLSLLNISNPFLHVAKVVHYVEA